jgi:hypothetical protein
MSKSALTPHQVRPIRVGFDLDGVLLYNPVRIFRPIITWVKRVLLGRKKTKFFVPKTYWQQQIFIWLHRSSLWVAPGLDEIKALKVAGVIEPYLVTARFDFLKPDLDEWLERMKAHEIFTEVLYNQANEQPFTFKAKQIERLELEIFVEDNWDVVQKLQELVGPKRPTFVCWWVSNILDWSQPYAYKVSSLQTALQGIKATLLPESPEKL